MEFVHVTLVGWEATSWTEAMRAIRAIRKPEEYIVVWYWDGRLFESLLFG